MPATLVFSEATLLDSWMAISPCFPHAHCLVAICPDFLFLYGHQSYSIRAHPEDLILPHYISLKTLPKYSPILRSSTYEFGAWVGLVQPIKRGCNMWGPSLVPEALCDTCPVLLLSSRDSRAQEHLAQFTNAETEPRGESAS